MFRFQLDNTSKKAILPDETPFYTPRNNTASTDYHRDTKYNWVINHRLPSNQLTWFRSMQKKYYILKLDSYEGEDSSLLCTTHGRDYMYSVLLVTDTDAEIIDMGYPDLESLLSAWHNTHFQNLGNL